MDNRPEAITQRKMQVMANNNTAQQQQTIQKKENKTGLPDNLKSGIENLFGHSMDDVKVHYNSDRPAQLQAHAYAQGTDIHLASGQERHLPHEAWHVVQQKQGRVKPTMQLQGKVNINDYEGLEKEADVMGGIASSIHSDLQNMAYVPQRKSHDSLKVTQLKPAKWNNNPTLEYIKTLPHGWFSTWKEIKAEIGKYQELNPLNRAAIRSSLVKMRQLINEWKQDPKHQADTTDQRVKDILAILPVLEAKIREEVADYNSEVLESRDNGHSIARHGPDLTEAELDRRLHTGIAPDNVLSPAPGASSQFITYQAYLETRQTAATSLQNAIAAAQASVLTWKQQALALDAHGQTPLVNEATANTAARDTAVGNAAASQMALDQYGAANDNAIAVALSQKKTREAEIATLDEEFEDLEAERDGGMDMWDEQTPPAEEPRLSEINERLAAIPAKRAQAVLDFNAATAVYDNLNNPKTVLRNTNLANQALVQPAEDAKVLADNERDHPEFNLRRYLHDNAGIELDVNDDAVANSFAATIRLAEQYSVVVDHGKDIGSGRAGTGAVSLTGVYNAVTDQTADPHVPLGRPAVLGALTGLGLVNDREDLADFIVAGPAIDGTYPNLQRLRAKGARGGEAFTGSVAANNLQKTFTMFACGTRTLFGANDVAILVVTRAWRAIQHFPAKPDAAVGVQELA